MHVSIVNHFNERGVYTGSSVQHNEYGGYETIHRDSSEERAKAWCEQFNHEVVEVLEDEV